MDVGTSFDPAKNGGESNLTLQWTVNQRFGVQVIYHYFGTDQAQINFLRYF